MQALSTDWTVNPVVARMVAEKGGYTNEQE
jgi:hypothetical protein